MDTLETVARRLPAATPRGQAQPVNEPDASTAPDPEVPEVPNVAEANLPGANLREVVGQSIDAARATQRLPPRRAARPTRSSPCLGRLLDARFHKAAELISMGWQLANRTFDQAGLTTFSRSGCPISRVITCDLANAFRLGLVLTLS